MSGVCMQFCKPFIIRFFVTVGDEAKSAFDRKLKFRGIDKSFDTSVAIYISISTFFSILLQEPMFPPHISK